MSPNFPILLTLLKKDNKRAMLFLTQAAIVAKELNEFLSHYRRETEFFTVFREEAGMVPRHTFEEFVAFANDSDLEEVLTVQTKLYRCAHIFLGKCLPPVNGKRHSLLRLQSLFRVTI